MSESERQHVQARVRAAMDAQVVNEGRHQGGRTPSRRRGCGSRRPLSPGKCRSHRAVAAAGASAEQLDDEDLVVASGDQQLLAAWTELGMATFDTNQPTTSMADATGEE